MACGLAWVCDDRAKRTHTNNNSRHMTHTKRRTANICKPTHALTVYSKYHVLRHAAYPHTHPPSYPYYVHLLSMSHTPPYPYNGTLNWTV